MMDKYNSHDVAELVSDAYKKGIDYTEARVLRLISFHKPDVFVPGQPVKFYCGCQMLLPEEARVEYYDHITSLIKSERLMPSPYY